MFKRTALITLLILESFTILFCNESILLPDDIITVDKSSGFDLWIKKKSGIESILIVEPLNEVHEYQYSLRSITPNNSKRIVNGEFIDQSEKVYSLIDSKAETHNELGYAFHIFIPQKVIFGYHWGRNGEIIITNGTAFTIRTFEKKYADYTGKYNDYSFTYNKNIDKVVKKEDVMTESNISDCISLNSHFINFYLKFLFSSSYTKSKNIVDIECLDLDIINENLDYALRKNKEHGYILDPSDNKNIQVFISKLFRFNPKSSIKTGDIGCVFRNNDEAIAYIRFTVSENEITADLIELITPDKPINPLDKIVLDLQMEVE